MGVEAGQDFLAACCWPLGDNCSDNINQVEYNGRAGGSQLSKDVLEEEEEETRIQDEIRAMKSAIENLTKVLQKEKFNL